MNPIGLADRLAYAFRRRGDVAATLRAALEGCRGWMLDFGGGEGRVAAALAPSIQAPFAFADIDGRGFSRNSGASIG
ncbi:MAG: hypothetical protein ACT4PV_01590 [Planctomycetaceae bacterium]